MSTGEPPAPSPLPTGVDVRLVAVDMDGTLLGADHRPPDRLADLLAALEDRGVAFCPASGRQYESLRAVLGEHVDDVDRLSFVAENGAHVVHRGEVVSTDTVRRPVAHDIVRVVRDLAADGVQAGVVLCGERSAYVERTDEPFLGEASRYYAVLETVPDLLEVTEDVLKVAVHDVDGVQHAVAPALERFRPDHQVVVSGEHWADVMSATTHKGHGVRELQRRLGVTPEQTVAFGDYPNDVEMLDAAHWSFAMQNAHPDVLRRARLVAPANTDDGVVRVLATLLDLDLPGVRPVA